MKTDLVREVPEHADVSHTGPGLECLEGQGVGAGGGAQVAGQQQVRRVAQHLAPRHGAHTLQRQAVEVRQRIIVRARSEEKSLKSLLFLNFAFFSHSISNQVMFSDAL